MGRGAESEVLLVVPIDVIVSTFVTGQGPIGDLLPQVPVRFENAPDEVVGIGGLVFIGVTPGVISEWRAGLRRERVATDMGRWTLQPQEIIQGALHIDEA